MSRKPKMQTEAEMAFDRFVATSQTKYPKAVECLVKDREGWRAWNGSQLLPEVVEGMVHIAGRKQEKPAA